MGKPQGYRQALILLLSTCFLIGYLPLMPGTFGSLAGIALFFLLKGNLFFYAAFILLLIAAGTASSSLAEKILEKKDPNCIVIDEVAGMLLSLFLLPGDIKVIFLAFLIFRGLDTVKPFPADRMQKLKSGWGVMSDDLIAGLYTNIILQVALRLASFKIS